MSPRTEALFGSVMAELNDLRISDERRQKINRKLCQFLSQVEKEVSGTRDETTGLLRKSAFMQRLMRELHALAPRHLCALVVFDVANFKEVNDNCGHVVGDAILSQTGNTIRSFLHKEEAGGRMGGDEFALLLLDLPSDDALRVRSVVEAIRGRMSLCPVSCGNKGRIPGIDIDVGIVLFGVGGPNICSMEDAEVLARELYKRADDISLEQKRKRKAGEQSDVGVSVLRLSALRTEMKRD